MEKTAPDYTDARELNDTAAKLEILRNYRGDSVEFGIEPEEYKKDYIKAISEKLERAQNVLQFVGTDWIDYTTGNKVININKANLWFTKNVYLLFSIGKIFDAMDSEFFYYVIDYFNKETQSIYLGCRYKVLNHKQDIIKKIEKKIHIENGNYHVLMVIIVYAKESKLDDAPEDLFNNRGIVKYCIDHEEIKEAMLQFLDRYGLITNEPQIIKTPPNISGRRDGVTLAEAKFKYTDDVDWNSGPNRLLISDLCYRNDRDESFAIRTRMKEDARIFPRDRKERYRNQKSAYDRIKENNIAWTTPQFNKITGINSKMVDNVIPSDIMNDNTVLDFDMYNGATIQGEIKNERPLINSPLSNEFPVNYAGDYSQLFNYGVDGSMQLSDSRDIRKHGRTVPGMFINS